MNCKSLHIISLICYIILSSSCNKTYPDQNSEKPIKKIKTSEVYPEINFNPYFKKDSTQLKIKDRLHQFFSIKDSNLRAFEFWKASDFDSFMFPYQDLLLIEENHKKERYFFKPTILEIIPIDESSEYLIKIAFIGNKNGENYLKCIYNLIIDTLDFKFRKVISHNTKNWKEYTIGNITYYNSPLKAFNKSEAEYFDIFNHKMAQLFEIEPQEVTYYSCVNAKETFEIQGFDFRHNMYLAREGGQADAYSNIIYSGKNSERYDHELTHIYTYKKYFKSIENLRLLNEGLATYLGGSGSKSYLELRKNLEKLLKNNKDIDLLNFTNPYYDNKEENLISYTVGALLCERAIRLKGKQKFLDIFKSNILEEALDFININMNNLNQELILELKTSPMNRYSIFQ